MHVVEHPLLSPALGTRRHVTSLHFGRVGAGPKVVLQASLHADELPGMLVLHHLRGLLLAAEAKGEVVGEVVLVPVANPIGLDQTVLHAQLGRFELASGNNFNRHYPAFADWVADAVEPQLGQDAAVNVQVIRRAMHTALNQRPPRTELDSLRQTLMRLSLDADVALDLHCDFEATVHLYTEPPCADTLLPLAALLDARAVLLAKGSGSRCYDEALSSVWWQLAERFQGRFPIPQGCASTTVELRGQTDVRQDLAQADAQALMTYLQHLGALSGPPPALPALACRPTPLSGTEVLTAPHPGVLTYLCEPGDDLSAGDTVAEVIDPLTGQVSPVVASVSGVLYARHIVRWATAGLEVGKIAGAVPFRTGPLLGA